MRATVLTDKALAKHAGRFVWLSIDTENEKNAAFLQAYPYQGVPTFEVLEPASGRVAYVWLGAVDAKQFLKRLDEAEAALRRESLTTVAKPDSADSDVVDLSLAGKNEECARRALALLPTLPPGGVRANVAVTGLDCALGADETAPWRKDALATLEKDVRDATRYEGLLSDDRAALFAGLVDTRDRLGDPDGAKAVAKEFLGFLDRDGRTASSVEARASLDGWRVSAAIAAGEPARALEALRASERDLPNDYNPPARLAVVLREMGRYDEALAASDRALAKAYGPRKLGIYDARATIFEKKGDPAAAKAVLQEALKYAAGLPEPQRPKRTVERIEKRLAGM